MRCSKNAPWILMRLPRSSSFRVGPIFSVFASCVYVYSFFSSLLSDVVWFSLHIFLFDLYALYSLITWHVQFSVRFLSIYIYRGGGETVKGNCLVSMYAKSVFTILWFQVKKRKIFYFWHFENNSYYFSFLEFSEHYVWFNWSTCFSLLFAKHSIFAWVASSFCSEFHEFVGHFSQNLIA